MILGNEFAGVIQALGRDVSGFAGGHRVSATTTPASAATTSTSPSWRRAVGPMPDGLGYVAIAPATEGSHYALTTIRAGRAPSLTAATGPGWSPRRRLALMTDVGSRR